MTLREIGTKHKAQKCAYHYIEIYEEWFAPLRMQAITLVEIGVLAGGSLLMWEEWFPKAKIVGVDIDPQFAPAPESRITVVQADAGNQEAMEAVARDHGMLSVIVDDASHDPAQWMSSLGALWPYLLPGGWHVIEDTSTPFHFHRHMGQAAQVRAFLAEFGGNLVQAIGQKDVIEIRLRESLIGIHKKG